MYIPTNVLPIGTMYNLATMKKRILKGKEKRKVLYRISSPRKSIIVI